MQKFGFYQSLQLTIVCNHRRAHMPQKTNAVNSSALEAQSVKILVILNPTGYMLTSSGFAYSSEVYSTDSSKMIGNSPEVSNFIRLFLKLNRFICNQLPVLSETQVNRFENWLNSGYGQSPGPIVKTYLFVLYCISLHATWKPVAVVE